MCGPFWLVVTMHRARLPALTSKNCVLVVSRLVITIVVGALTTMFSLTLEPQVVPLVLSLVTYLCMVVLVWWNLLIDATTGNTTCRPLNMSVWSNVCNRAWNMLRTESEMWTVCYLRNGPLLRLKLTHGNVPLLFTLSACTINGCLLYNLVVRWQVLNRARLLGNLLWSRTQRNLSWNSLTFLVFVLRVVCILVMSLVPFSMVTCCLLCAMVGARVFPR